MNFFVRLWHRVIFRSRIFLVPRWTTKRWDSLLKEEKRRIIHDPTIPDEVLEEEMLKAAKRIDRQVRREGRYIMYRLQSRFKQKILQPEEKK